MTLLSLVIVTREFGFELEELEIHEMEGQIFLHGWKLGWRAYLQCVQHVTITLA